MDPRQTSQWRRPACLTAAILVGCLFQFILSCGDAGDKSDSATPRKGLESFTFFDIGRNSLFSERLRGDLADRLGNDAIERRSIIDLEINYKGFLRDHLPALDALNRQLNHPPGERVDHDVIRLMYRYARNKNSPFDYVELVFDGQSHKPLVFRMRFRVDETGTVESLRTKYGSPDDVRWGVENSEALVWHKERDVLVLSLLPDKFGVPIYHITLYFTENLEGLIASEQAMKERTSKEKTQSPKSAF
jgi:hypothetical protein